MVPVVLIWRPGDECDFPSVASLGFLEGGAGDATLAPERQTAKSRLIFPLARSCRRGGSALSRENSVTGDCGDKGSEGGAGR